MLKAPPDNRPLIGISCDLDNQSRHYELPVAYRQAIETAGGVPLLLAPTDVAETLDRIFDVIDGLLIPGGNDLDPALYRQPPHPKTIPMDPLRQRFDLALLKGAQNIALPTLGVCLGCQTINVMRGGTLIQYVPEYDRQNAVPHAGDRANLTDRNAWHNVSIFAKSRLAEVFQKESLQVNSRHRQALDEIGDGLTITARASDGIIEAVEDPSLPFFLGVQWHPEGMHDESADRLFGALIRAAQSFSREQ